jgi:membrane-bound ClpP family serine protease
LCLGLASILGGTGLALALARVRVPPIRWWAVVMLIVAVPLVRLMPAWVAMTFVSVVVAGLAMAEESSQHARGVSEASV